MSTLGDNLRRRREYLGYSTIGLAERAEVNWNLLTMYEAAVLTPEEDELARLARALRTDVEDLRSGARPRLVLIHGGRNSVTALAADGPEAA